MNSQKELEQSFSVAMSLLYVWRISPTLSGKPPQGRRAVEAEDFTKQFTREEFVKIAEPTLEVLADLDNPVQALAIYEAFRYVQDCYDGRNLF